MKKLILTLSILFTISNTCYSSHLLGGEITWQCLGTGEYIFKLRLYRDCSGIPLNATDTIKVNGHPSLCAIPVTATSVTDLSPAGCGYSCATGNFRSVEEWVYTSSPIMINGIPPAAGWVFYFENCCRSVTTNITNSVSGGMHLRSVMYPYLNTNAGPCFDSSPTFVEIPYSSTSGYSYNYIPFAIDNELDSVNFSLDTVRDAAQSGCTGPFQVTSLTFSPPYSPSNQLPGVMSFDPFSGAMNINNTGIQGNFVVSNKATAYKCGVKVAEVYRDVVFRFDTPVSLPAGGINTPPDANPPFIDPLSGLQTSYIDTVFAGDTVRFNLQVTDFEMTAIGLQQVTANLIGTQVGAGGTSPFACNTPPCLTTNAGLPATSQIASNVQCTWVTTNDHLGLNYPCAYMPNTYRFLYQFKDNVCPTNASSANIITITVLPTIPSPVVTNNAGTLTVNAPGYNYQWYANRFPVAGATLQSFTPSFNAAYQCRIIDPVTGAGNYSSKILVNTLVENLESSNNLVVYPNPATEKITVQLSDLNGNNVAVRIFDIAGKMLKEIDFGKASSLFRKQISTDNLPNGIYEVMIMVDERYQSKRITISH